MSEFELRPAAPSDIPDIVEIWSLSFGDDPAFISALLQEAMLLPSALCAAKDGHVRSVMFAFEDLSLEGTPAAYLYALCTHPEARGRGMGAAVVRALTERCFSRGAETVFLAPASAQLSAWYMQILDTNLCSFFCNTPVPTLPCDAECIPLDAAEYFAARQSEICITQQLLDAQQTLHRFFGGGFFRINVGEAQTLACAAPTEDALLVRELLCPDHLRPSVCGALAKYFDRRRVLLRQSSESGHSLVYINSNRDHETAPCSTAFPYLLE